MTETFESKSFPNVNILLTVNYIFFEKNLIRLIYYKQFVVNTKYKPLDVKTVK